MVNPLRSLFHPQRRAEPSLDVGLPAERTAMAWQRTGLALAGFAALLVHLADRNLLLAVPGFAGFAMALVLLVGGERRYLWTVRRIEADQSCMAPRMVLSLAATVLALSVTAMVVVVAVGT